MPFITKLGAVAARAYGWLASVAQAVVSSDTYFYLVSMLLPGNGTNGATNNTFLDSSTNNFTITRNGNTTQGTFSPFSQTGWSNYFDGSGDSLSYTGGSSLNFGTSDFTIELWGYLTNTGTFSAFLRPDDNGSFPEFGYDFSAGVLKFDARNGIILNTTVAMPVQQWVHLAVSRSGTTLRQFINGVQVGSVTNSTNFASTTGLIRVGGSGFSSAHSVLGYISNFRVVKGVALYTNSFTPPATPLTAVSGTSLLTCQSNRIVDNSANNFTITRNGDVAVQAFSPFVPNNISPTSYSGWFDGSGDYLTAPNNAAFSYAGDFTIECWIYPTSVAAATQGLYSQIDNGADTWTGVRIALTTSSFVGVGYNTIGDQLFSISHQTAVVPGAWAHVAMTRSGSTIRIFLNGVVGTTTYTSSQTFGQSGISIGTLYPGTNPFTGLISNLRVVNGTAVYTSNFTPPTVPLTAIANTSLLTCQNATFIDNSTNAFTITVNGNAQPITNNPFQTPSPNPISYSGYFDGSGDYLSAANNAAFDLGTGAFTIEAWVYISGNSTADSGGTRPATIFCAFPSSGSATGYNLLINGNASTTGTGVIFNNFVSGTQYQISVTATVAQNAWNHIAAVRSGTVTTIYLNGVSIGSGTLSNQNVNTGGNLIKIGGLEYAGYANELIGYISNLRVVKGTALYTANFIPSNTPLTAVSGTSLLTCQNNRFVDNSTNAFAITVNGNTIPVMTNPYGYATPISSTAYGGAFDGGTTTRLTFPSNTAFAFGTGAYTMEAWVYLTSYATTFSTAIFDCGSTTNSAGMFVTTSGALFLNLYGVGSVIQTSTTIPLNTWTHIAISRQSTAASSTRLFINGVLGATGTDSNNWTVTTTPGVGGIGLAGYTVSGFVSNVRIVKGTAVYTAAFTPSTTPLTAISGTSLLTCQNIVFADNSSNAFTATANGNTAPTPVNPFGYSAPTAPTSVSYSALTNGGSGYFDGTGDYLTVPNNAALNLSSGDFTIEGWFYCTALTGATQQIVNKDGVFNVSYPSYAVAINSSGNLILNLGNGAGISPTVTTYTGSVIALNTWTHFACVKTGTTIKIFQNGVGTVSTSQGLAIIDGGKAVYVGSYNTAASGESFIGYLSSLRIIKGTALYTAAFAPPVLPLTAVSNTQLLLNYTNAGIADAASQNVLETVGNAQISTAQSKWGGGSMAFDGTGDYLLPANLPGTAGVLPLALGTGNFTIEFWVYFAAGSTATRFLLDWRPSGTEGVYPTLYTTASSAIAFYVSSANRITGGAVSETTWTHIALCRSGTSTRLFLNGVQTGSTYTDSNNYLGPANRPVIGAAGLSLGGSALNGYIDDLRITKYARYTANFTPPTAAFPTQ